MSRDILAARALANIPNILGLLDRNRLSPTFGCFDRGYWHYRTADFPAGMAQQLVLPLALVHRLALPDNPYRDDPVIKEFVEAGIDFAAGSAHGDGSADDYYPFERAAGASAFALYACLMAAEILGLGIARWQDFFQRRARWLAGHRESGRLANHEALTALAVLMAGRALDDAELLKSAEIRLARCLSWQHAEGWFQEYEGCDPAYGTITLALLAQYHHLAPSEPLKQALGRAARFIAQVQHPDGTLGGEYASRNLILCYPQGFELAGAWMPEALSVNDRFVAALAEGRGPTFRDDRTIAHETIAYLLAWRDWRQPRPPIAAPQAGRRWFEGASLLVERRDDLFLIAGLNKGGAFKLFRGGACIASDTQITVQTGAGRTAVAHMLSTGNRITLGDGEVTVEGRLAWAKGQRMTPLRLLALRLFMLGPGRFCADCVRRLLQKILIVGKTDAPYRFRRRFRWIDGGLTVEDRLQADDWADAVRVMIGTDQTSVYVAGSRNFQPDQMFPWHDLTALARTLRPGQALVHQRSWPAP